MRPSYVILHPARRDNPTDQYLVVHLREWVAITLGEKTKYTFASEHEDYTSATTEYDRLNQRSGETSSWTAPELSTTSSGTSPKSGGFLMKRTPTTSSTPTATTSHPKDTSKSASTPTLAALTASPLRSSAWEFTPTSTVPPVCTISTPPPTPSPLSASGTHAKWPTLILEEDDE